jgi:hypothetical protein
MTLSLPFLLSLVWETILSPREAARQVMAIDLPRAIRWQALFALVLVGSVLAVTITWMITGHPVMYLGVVPATPFVAAIVSLSGSVFTVFAIFWIGRAMGGTGGFGDAISLVAWTQFVVICMQLVQLAAFILLSPVSAAVDIAAALISIWILTNFIAELHSFKSLSKVFLMIIVTMLGLAFGLSLILAIIGVSVPGVDS